MSIQKILKNNDSLRTCHSIKVSEYDMTEVYKNLVNHLIEEYEEWSNRISMRNFFDDLWPHYQP